MNTVEIIRKKRDGNSLSPEEIETFINGYIKNKIPDYQFSAFLMAVFYNGMNTEETASLTRSMLYSGKVINLNSIPGVKIDKHSTGGVGDKTSLIIAPIAAAAGVKVPMISGRGLGHTGGTLDKLESIPGFNTGLNLTKYKSIVNRFGAVLIGQTKQIAPADKLIYALRDVTATIESIPLITSSIMSKKLAEGIDGLVLDIKTGNGAFMREYKDARKLAEALIGTAKTFKKKVVGFITDMNQPTGNYIGNWLEVYESIKLLQGEDIPDLLTISLNLAGAMLYLGKKSSSIEEGIEISKKLIKNGKAFDKFIQIIKAQGGNVNYIKSPDTYPKSKFVEKIYSLKKGYLSKIDTYELGMISLELGAGRRIKEDTIDHKAGIVFYPKIGDWVNKGDILAEFHTDKKNKIDLMKNKFYNIISYSNAKIKRPKLVKEIIM